MVAALLSGAYQAPTYNTGMKMAGKIVAFSLHDFKNQKSQKSKMPSSMKGLINNIIDPQ